MSVTNFPMGVSSFGFPLIGSGPVLTTGRVFFVNSATGVDSAGYGTDKDRPFDTIDFAVGQCVANRGDVIFVMPGHTETISAAGGLDLDVAGITIIGIGRGTLRPVINIGTATTADIDVDAASITLINFIINGQVDALVAPIDVNASDFAMIGCEYRDVVGQVVDLLIADANADRMIIRDFIHRGDSAAGSASSIVLIGCDDVLIENFIIDGNFSAAAIECRTTAVVRMRVRNGHIFTRNAADLCIRDLITASTGEIGPNLYLRLTDNAANITEAVTGATFVVYDDVFVVNLAGEKAMLINWTASTDA